MGRSSIEWTDETWNPTRGCDVCSPGCANCYAMRMAGRFSGVGWAYNGLVTIAKSGRSVWNGEVVFDAKALAKPLTWRKPRRVFVNSMSDLFYDRFTNEQIAAVFGVMAATPHITYQVLTKRAKRMREWFEWAKQHGDGYDSLRFGPSALLTCAWEACSGEVWGDIDPPVALESLPSKTVFGMTWPLPNVWLGVSVENQDAHDERAEDLLDCPAAIHFFSVEPMIGAVDASQSLRRMLRTTDGRLLRNDHPDAPGIGGVWRRPVDWVIVGCESGPKRRPCDDAWIRVIRDQCKAAGTAFFLKQAYRNGVLESLPELDGVQHAEFPQP